MKEIELYTTADGRCPYIEWFDALCMQYQSRIYKRLERVEEGYFGDYKRLQNSRLSELRFNFGKGYQFILRN